jgi:predicted transcriptional regulator
MEITPQESQTKHEQILRYIQSLQAGTRISVRKIAKQIGVSEGTAYRAIKEAEELGFVATKERVGTVRIERKERQNIDKLTFAEVVKIVDGEVLAGVEGLGKLLVKFVIGAMQLEAMVKYIDAGCLLIIGNREKAHMTALELGAGILITGGFGVSEEVKRKADELALPIISTSYDTFTVASLINRAIYDRLIKKKILLVEDIMIPIDKVTVLHCGMTVADWHSHVERTGYSRFPVVDEHGRLCGMITPKDVVGAVTEEKIERLMSKHPIVVSPQTTLASAAHLMVWEGIEQLPVIDGGRKLIGIISRQDVLKGLQFIQKQPQIGETVEDLVLSQFQEVQELDGGVALRGTITPLMTSAFGTVSEGVITTLMSHAAFRAIKRLKKGDIVVDSMSTFFLKPLQIDYEITVRPQIIELSRKFGKVDVEVRYEQQLVAKAMVTVQLIDQM